MKKQSPEAGQSMVLMAILMLLVFIPLLAIAMNIPKAIYVRVQLQAATDAACEAAAQAIDWDTFQNSGVAQIDLGLGRGWAQREFVKTVINSGMVGYSPGLTSVTRISPLIAECHASASVGGYFHSIIGTDFMVTAVSVSESRVESR